MDMEKIIGRKEEVALLEGLKNASKSAFVAIYGRRRVGKTYLVRQVLGSQFNFYFTGTANINTKQQLANFHAALTEQFHSAYKLTPAKDWFEAFRQLAQLLEAEVSGQKTIFLDELPWLDNPKSGFLPALEYFWNSRASTRHDVLLIT
jgi:uncharacterized protein